MKIIINTLSLSFLLVYFAGMPSFAAFPTAVNGHNTVANCNSGNYEVTDAGAVICSDNVSDDKTADDDDY
ncbi:MAG: hypothetical protein AAGA27_05805 [Pseudomonadota bacterium]